MTRDELIAAAARIAGQHGIEPALVQAVCHNESSWRPWAVRYELAFYDRYIVPLKGLSATERQMRSTSWGLMQIMGQTARELGFAGDYLTELCDPLTNLEFGCRKLARCLDRASQDMRLSLLGYNGGGDKGYPDRVLLFLPRYRDITTPAI